MSTPLFDPDDPRLTAYALGEASTDERQAVEQLLAVSPEARAAVEQTRSLVGHLEEDYRRENAAYQEAHPSSAIPANVIPFPGPRRRWRPAVAVAWKAAAVFVALGSLVWFAARRGPSAPVASAPFAARTQETAPPVDRLEPNTGTSEPLAAAPSGPTPTASLPAPGGTNELLADATGQEARDEVPALGQQPSVAGASRAKSNPFAAEPPFLAAARPAPAPPAPRVATSSVDERLKAATVRIRFGDGTYAGGVLLTANGWLVAGPQSSKGMPAPGNVTLADGREFPVAALTLEPQTGLELIQVKTTGLPFVALAKEAPANGDRLVVARFDERTGIPSFAETRATVTGELAYTDGASSEVEFVFNAAGELLARGHSHPARVTIDRARASQPASPTPLNVHPFTASERAALKRATK